MHPKVRDLYKRFLVVGRDYPTGLNHVREKVKLGFITNQHISQEKELFKEIKKGRQIVQEMIGVIQLKKYRSMNDRYTSMQIRDNLIKLKKQKEYTQESDKKVD